MLPFPQPASDSSEIELGDDDLVVLEEDGAMVVGADELIVPPPASVLRATARRPLPAVTPPPPKLAFRKPLGSLAGPVEDHVAEECLASIAREASRARQSERYPGSLVPPPEPPVRQRTIAPPAPVSSGFIDDAAETARLPAYTGPAGAVAAAVPPSTPPPAFARVSLPAIPPSVAPITFSAAPEPTVIIVQKPPRTGWLLAAAAFGAIAAILALQLVSRTPARSAPPATAAAPTTTAAAQAANPPPAPAAPPASVVSFGPDDAVAIRVVPATPAPMLTLPMPASAPPPPTPHPVVAVKPKAPKPQPILTLPPAPSSTFANRTQPSPPPPAAAPAPAPKRKLTPEQELAEAQLRASMR